MEHVHTKAEIRVLDGRFKNFIIPVLFNPSEYSLEISNSFQETALPGLESPIHQFINGNTRTLSMELLFDTWTDKKGIDVSLLTDRFADMLSIDSDVHAPPRVEFIWGRLIFKAVIESWSQKFTMFNAAGLPVRANVSVSFKQYKTISEQLIDPRRSSSDKTKRHIFKADDSIWALAAIEYGEPRYWRLIARHNRIEDPRRVQPGDILWLPPLDSDSFLGREYGY